MSEQGRLDIEPEAESTPSSSLALISALPEINILTLLRFLPDLAFKRRVEEAASAARAIKVEGRDGVERATAALVPVRAAIEASNAAFEDPCSLANQLHKRLTGLRIDFRRVGEEVVVAKSAEVYAETRRLDRIIEDARIKAQAEADRQAREAAAAAAKAAKAEGASQAVVEVLKQQAKTATAAPVASPIARPTLHGMTMTAKWRARFVGTPDGAEPNPDVADYSVRQQAQARRLLRAIADGKVPLAAAPLDWGYLNKRAAAEKSTLDIPEIEAFDAGGTRKK